MKIGIYGGGFNPGHVGIARRAIAELGLDRLIVASASGAHDEFMEQLADPSYHGLCHCHLYLKP